MIFFLFLVLPTQLEIVKAQDYATRRFAEVISNAVDADNLSPQEKLTALRARVITAERQFNELQAKRGNAQTPQEKEEAPKIVQLRAAEARVDYYKSKISELERQVLLSSQKKKKLKSKR